MKIYFGDSEYDGQFLRAIDCAPAGAQIGENEPGPPNAQRRIAEEKHT